jgi:hypothetical protein
MQITEPTTMITDYLVAALALTLGWRLLQDSKKENCLAERWWAWAFFATAAGALAGGTSHGFTHYLGESGWRLLWQITVYAIGLASLCLMIAALKATFTAGWLGTLALLAAARFGFYTVWMWHETDFKYVIYDYGSTMVVVLALQAWTWFKHRAASAPWIVAGILVSFVASQIQLQEIGFHRHFNHNDLFHVIQMLGIWLLYRGGLHLTDADSPSPSRTA